MLTKHRSIRVLLFVLILALQSMLVPTTAYAASDYDSVIKPGGNALVSNHWGASGGVCGALQPLVADGVTSWSSLVLDSSKYLGSAAYSSDKSNAIDAFDDAVNSGKGWALVQNIASSNYASVGGADMKAGDTYLTVYFSDSQTLEFKTASGLKLLVMKGNWYALSISYAVAGSDCKVGVTQILHGTGYSYGVPVQQDGNTNEKAMFINFDIAYLEGYDGPTVSTVMPPPTYVAMGDSFSTAEGNPPFEGNTNLSGVNECHRSPQAYPHILQADSSLGLMDFVACSGATTSNVLNGQWNEPAQVDALSNNTRIVTITVGGNDIKFKEFAIACVIGTTCDSTSSEYQESWEIMTDSSRSDYLPGKLELLLDTVKTYLYANPNFQVYVVGYPYVVTHASWEDNAPGTCNYLTEAEANAAVNIVQELDTTIHTAVTVFDDERFVYVDPLATGSPFLGHELCTSGGYFNGIEASGAFGGNDAYVFHPNENGQQAYADLIESYMS